MSLSFLVKLVCFSVLALASGLAANEYARPVASYFTEAREITAGDTRISQRAIVYRLPEENPVGFVFTQPVTKSKVIIHPAVLQEFQSQEAGFVYGVRVRWFDAEGKELSEHEVYLQADSPAEVFASGASTRFFRTRSELVAEQDVLVIESPAPATSLEVESLDVPEGVVGIDVRIFEQRSYLGNQSLAAYLRISEDTKGLLTRPNAFPSNMLTPEEKSALARNHWRAVGPLGLDGRDYEMLVLYEAVRENWDDDDAEATEAVQ